MDALIFSINKILFASLVIGSIYALGAIGITLIFSILRFAHFAHADIMTFGTLIAYGATVLMPDAGAFIGLPTGIVFLPLAMVLTAVACYGIDRVVYEPLRNKGAKPIIFLMASIGVALIVQGLIRLTVGVSSRSFYIAERKDIFRISLPEGWANQKLTFSEPQVLLVFFLIIAVVSLHLFLSRSRLGKAMRATSDNPMLARISGIPPQKVIRVTWIIGGCLAAVAGVMLSLDVTFKPDLSFNILLPMFAAAILGGVGNPYGAVIGAFVVAFCENLVVFNWSVILREVASLLPAAWEIPPILIIVPSEYKIAVPFVILVLILIWRPTGIMKGQVL